MIMKHVDNPSNMDTSKFYFLLVVHRLPFRYINSASWLISAYKFIQFEDGDCLSEGISHNAEGL